MGNSKKPSIRFKNFDDAWEQCKIKDIADRYDNLRIPVAANLRVPGSTPYYGANGIQDYVDGYTHEGEFVLVAEDGANDLKNYPVKCVNGRIWVNNHAHVLQGKAEIADNPFIAYSINQANIESLLVGGGRAKLNAETLMDIELSLPTLPEQREIGIYLKRLDNLITLHQRKYEALLNVKKSMLQKMFPKNGETEPEIRFKGFSDAWEQRKLGQQMYIKARIGWQALTKSEYLESGDYYLITGTDIDENTHTVDLKRCFYVSKERYEMDDKIQVHEGDIIVTKDGTIGKVAMVTGLDKPATLNSHLFVLRDLSGKIDNYFLLTVLNSHVFDSFVENTKTGSTLTGMPQKTFVKFSFLLPNTEEQRRIASFFQNLDNLITLHQRKLEMLKNIKKSMLQKMFV